MSETILVAGATGTLGSHVVEALRGRGHRVRALSRHFGRANRLRGLADEIVVRDMTRPHAMEAVFRGVDAVVSCLGATTAFTPSQWRGYRAVDTVANVNLVDAARVQGVRRFVYAAVHREDGYAGTAYLRAHEEVVSYLRRSELSFGVVRHTGLFPIFEQLLPLARLGLAGVAGDGRARTNPVHPADVAAICADLLETGMGREVDVGGPDIVTREEIARMACRAVGRTPRVLHVPPAPLRAAASALRPFHPRLGDLLDFAVLVFTHDCVAPAVGRRHLADYLMQVADRSRRRPAQP